MKNKTTERLNNLWGSLYYIFMRFDPTKKIVLTYIEKN